MKQLDWIGETYNDFNTTPTGIKIWYRTDEPEPDLLCDVVKVEGHYVDFYVINGDWYGRLDLAIKSMTTYNPWREDSVLSYGKIEFIFGEEDD